MADLSDFEAALRSHLMGESAITSIIGSKITPVVMQEGTEPPALTYSILGVTPQTTLDGDDDGLIGVHLQTDSWARSHDQAVELGEAVRARMVTSSFKAIPEQEDDNGRSLYEDETKLHRFHWRFICWFPT